MTFSKTVVRNVCYTIAALFLIAGTLRFKVRQETVAHNNGTGWELSVHVPSLIPIGLVLLLGTVVYARDH